MGVSVGGVWVKPECNMSQLLVARLVRTISWGLCWPCIRAVFRPHSPAWRWTGCMLGVRNSTDGELSCYCCHRCYVHDAYLLLHTVMFSAHMCMGWWTGWRAATQHNWDTVLGVYMPAVCCPVCQHVGMCNMLLCSACSCCPSLLELQLRSDSAMRGCRYIHCAAILLSCILDTLVNR